MKRIVIFLIFSVMVLGACDSGSTETEIPQEPSQIEQVEVVVGEPSVEDDGTSDWAIAFEYEFSPKFWDEGYHEYMITADCPLPGRESSKLLGQWKGFAVSGKAPLVSEPIFFRLNGMSKGRLGPENIVAINVQQKTIASVSIIRLTISETELAASTCSATFRWGEEDIRTLSPQGAFKP